MKKTILTALIFVLIAAPSIAQEGKGASGKKTTTKGSPKIKVNTKSNLNPQPLPPSPPPDPGSNKKGKNGKSSAMKKGK